MELVRWFSVDATVERFAPEGDPSAQRMSRLQGAVWRI
jgi:hypothetical protein